MEQLTLVLSDFEGPLDLLLHLIKQAKIDIYDIPIAEITSQYLDYLHQMQELQLDIAGDYLVLAATLMKIKSKLLLPKPPVLPEYEDEDYVDPRQELVEQLLAYQLFKQAAAILQDKATARQQLFAKPASLNPNPKITPLAPGVVKPRDLTAAVTRMLALAKQQVPLLRTIQNDEISITAKLSDIRAHLLRTGPTTFAALVNDPSDAIEIVTTFLALLELMTKQQVTCQQSDYESDIIVTLKERDSAEISS